MELVRLESIIRELREPDPYPNLRVARKHSLPDEKTLNNFTNYHTGFSPTAIKMMSKDEIAGLKERLRNDLIKAYGVQGADDLKN